MNDTQACLCQPKRATDHAICSPRPTRTTVLYNIRNDILPEFRSEWIDCSVCV